MEDDLNGRQPQWKKTSMEDNVNGRQPHWKTTSMEDDLNRRGLQWKTTLMYDDLLNSACLLLINCISLYFTCEYFLCIWQNLPKFTQVKKFSVVSYCNILFPGIPTVRRMLFKNTQNIVVQNTLHSRNANLRRTRNKL